MSTTEPTPQQVLDLPLEENDARAATVRGYLIELLATLWREQEGFSGKRPFGNSGWDGELLMPLIRAGFVGGTIDEDGYLGDISREGEQKAQALILAAIKSLGETAP